MSKALPIKEKKIFADLDPGDRFVAGLDQFIKLLRTAMVSDFEPNGYFECFDRRTNSVCPYTGELVWIDPDSEVAFLP